MSDSSNLMSSSLPPSLPPSPHPPTAVDLRHMTSNAVLANSVKDPRTRTPPRPSQHLHTTTARVGSRSPNSIPSSPTSVHSSSSAIFERDIEPIVCPSPPHTSTHPPNPHRIPRSKTTEQLDQSVPSVLDSAAAILTAPVFDEIAIVAPCLDAGRRSGFTSPIDSLRSRSPSPLGNGPSAANVQSLLLGIPSPTSQSNTSQLSSPQPGTSNISPTSQSPPSTARPFIQTNTVSGSVTPPSIVTPTSAYYSTASSVTSSPKTTTLEHPPHALPTLPQATSASAAGTSVGVPLPPSPTNNAAKRLSFMSYSDLLSSTPASLLPLSSFTTPASAEPPPHIPSVSGLAHATLPRVALSGIRDSVVLDDIGGEWEREGLGRGLEERLEEVLMEVGKA